MLFIESKENNITHSISLKKNITQYLAKLGGSM